MQLKPKQGAFCFSQVAILRVPMSVTMMPTRRLVDAVPLAGPSRRKNHLVVVALTSSPVFPQETP